MVQKILPLISLLALSPVLLGQSNPAARVLSIGDGDTLTIQQNGKRVTVRLACIDAPETTQRPWGQSSTLRLKQLAPVGSTVRVRSVENDRYGRLVAEIYGADGRSINMLQVASGQAFAYRQYLDACAKTQEQFLQAEAQAQRQQLGVWNPRNPLTIYPWDYRRQRRSGQQQSPSPEQRSGCDPSYPDVCIPPYPPDLDCGDISFRRFRVVGSDPHRFDGDREGGV